jgi:membrane protein YqaA with SNARE-associated domain
LETTSERPDQSTPSGEKANGLGTASVVITLVFVVTGMALSLVFKDEIGNFGVELMTRYGQGWVDVILFLLVAVSSTPLFLPVWCYAQVGVVLGYNVVHLAAVMAPAGTAGSLLTYAIGRYLADTRFARVHLPNIRQHPWIEGRSRKYVTLILFVGAASPIPCDVLYAACGFKRYPALLYTVTMLLARFGHYLYLGYGFKHLSGLF